jgi:hypothetical protein
MTKVADITLYTARTRSFLCNGKRLVIERYVPRVAAYIGKEVVPNRMSYAGQVPDRISFCQTTLRIGASTIKATPCIMAQCRTYRSSTIHTSCRNTPQDQRMFQGLFEAAGLAQRTMIHFAPLFRALTCARS